MDNIKNWISDVASGVIPVKSKFSELSIEQKKEVENFLNTFDNELNSLQALQTAIVDGNILYLEQIFVFEPTISILNNIHFACKKGHLKSVIWLYRNYSHWFTDDCLLSSVYYSNNVVFRWLLYNATNIKFNDSYIESILKIKNYDGLVILYKYKLNKK